MMRDGQIFILYNRVETIMELDDICYNTMSVDVEATISNEKIVKKINHPVLQVVKVVKKIQREKD